MSTIGVWVLVGVVFATLYLFWVVLGFTFNLIESALADLRADQPSAEDGGEPSKEKEPSA